MNIDLGISSDEIITCAEERSMMDGCSFRSNRADLIRPVGGAAFAWMDQFEALAAFEKLAAAHTPCCKRSLTMSVSSLKEEKFQSNVIINNLIIISLKKF